MSARVTLRAVTDALPSRGGDASRFATSGRSGEAVAALSAAEIARVSGGELLVDSPRPVVGAAVDSRLVVPGNLFVALVGERTDGHRFLAAAAAAGAAAVLVRQVPSDQPLPPDVAVIRVTEPLVAFHAVAAAWRRRFSLLVVGVTGSIAKTSTKDAIAAVLAARLRTLKSEGNQNNEVGLPLTVLRIGPEHEAAALEMGMYTGGEIAQLAAIAQPQIGVVTAVHSVHLSRIGTLDAIERAKGELVEALPADGTAVLNADDERVRRMASRSRAQSITYGFADDADVRAEAIESLGRRGMGFDLVAAGERRGMVVPTLGRHAVHNALAAAAVGIVSGYSLDDVARGLARATTSAHRGELIDAGPITILDDSYNASPRSMRAAMELLASLPGRHVAVLGEMFELGDASEEGHREVGTIAAELVDDLVVIGDGASGIAEAAARAGLPRDRILHVADRPSAMAALRGRLRPGDVVLVKASRGAELDLLVAALRDEWRGSGGPTDAPGRPR
jgi:UDP-N-acetylmuramoyl-tripeptide--D-alanyl-D-alanine ligase